MNYLNGLSAWEQGEIEGIVSRSYYEQEQFDDFVDVSISDLVMSEDLVWFVLVLAGERSGCGIRRVHHPYESGLDSRPFEGLLFSVGVPYVSEGMLFPSGEDELCSSMEYTVLNGVGEGVMEDLYYGGLSDREYGRLLGYPEWAIDSFVECGGFGEHDSIVFGFEEMGLSIEELAYLQLVPFGVPEDRELVWRAIDFGRGCEQSVYGLMRDFEFLQGLDVWVDDALSYGCEVVEHRVSE